MQASYALVLLVVLLGLLTWALVRSVKAMNAGRRHRAAPPGMGLPPRAPWTGDGGGGSSVPSRPPSGGGPERRPALTVAAEVAGIAGLLIAFIALVRSGG
jgi:hypothetical protein